MKLTLTLLIALVAAFASTRASAADKFDPAAAAKEIAPFIDAQTLLVARLDVTKVDLPAVFTKIGDMIDQAQPDAQKGKRPLEIGAALAGARLLLAARQEELVKVGAGRIYLVLTLAEAPPVVGDDFVPFVFVAPGADNAKLQALLKQWVEMFQLDLPIKWDTVAGSTVVGSASALARLKTGKPAPRPDMSKAFAAAGDSAIQVLLLPSADTRRVIEELLPKLPEDFGGIPSRTITRGSLWASAGLDLPPRMGLHLTAQSEDPATAQALAKYVAGLPEMLLRVTEAGDGPIRAMLQALAPLVQPKAEGDRVLLTLDQKQIDQLITQVAMPALAEARESAMAAQRMSVEHQICTACFVYANEHQNEWPESLQQLVDAKALPAQLLLDAKTGKPGYVYRKPAQPMNKLAKAGETLIVYEAFEKWPGKAAVGYADGHIETIASEGQFRKLVGAGQ